MVTRRELVWTAAVATVAAGAGAGALLGASRPASGDGPEPAAAKRFLTRYVTADGQVVRRDQGGDTVSEGQAYAMLLTATSGDRDRFRRVWLSETVRSALAQNPSSLDQVRQALAHSTPIVTFGRGRTRVEIRRLTGPGQGSGRLMGVPPSLPPAVAAPSRRAKPAAQKPREPHRRPHRRHGRRRRR